jgi:xanthine/uracil permease
VSTRLPDRAVWRRWLWNAGLTLQWFFFVISGSLSFIVVAAVQLNLHGASRAGFATSVLVTVALSTILQALAGHRLPLFDGPSTPYLAMLILLGQTVPAPGVLRAELASSLIVAGLVICVVSWFSGRMLAGLFTPYVVASFLLLLGVTLVVRLAPAAVGHTATAAADPAAIWTLGAVLGVSAAIQRLSPRELQAFIFLIAYGVGLATFLVVGGSIRVDAGTTPILVVPQMSPLGVPDAGLLVVVVATMLIPLVNVYASIEAVAAAMPRRPVVDLRAATVLYGGSQVLAGLLGGMGTVPRSESAGLIAASGVSSRKPLLLAAAVLILVALIGPAVALLAAFPITVATDVLMVAVAFVTLIAWRIYRRIRWSRPRIILTAAGFLLCLLLAPISQGWGAISVFLTNPVLAGTVLAVLIDRLLGVAGRASAVQRS